MSDDQAEIRRLTIHEAQSLGKKLGVFCPRRAVEVELDDCSACSHCVGLSLRDSYLVCGWETVESAGAKHASHAQNMHQGQLQRVGSSSAPPRAAGHSSNPPVSVPRHVLVHLSRFERPVVTAELEETVLVAARRMRDHRVGCIVVVRDGVPVGMLTDRDLALRVVADGLNPAETLISRVATYEAATLSRDDGFETAVRLMKQRGVRRLPIVDENGRVTGIVTADDLIGLLGAELAALGEAIESNVDGTESR